MNNTMHGHQSYQTMADPPEDPYAEDLWEFICENTHGLGARLSEAALDNLCDTIYNVIEDYEAKKQLEDRMP